MIMKWCISVNDEWIFQKKRRSNMMRSNKLCLCIKVLYTVWWFTVFWRYISGINPGDLYFHGVDFHLGGGPISNIFCAFRTGPIFIWLFSKIMHYGLTMFWMMWIFWIFVEFCGCHVSGLSDCALIFHFFLNHCTLPFCERPGGLKRKESGHFLSIMKRLYLNVLWSSQML